MSKKLDDLSVRNESVHIRGNLSLIPFNPSFPGGRHAARKTGLTFNGRVCHGNPVFTNPALAGDTGTPLFIANYRNQWARLGEPFQTAAFSFDTYAEDAGVGLGFQPMHDQQSSVLKSTGLSGQVSKIAYLDGQKEVRLIGDLQTAWTSYR